MCDNVRTTFTVGKKRSALALKANYRAVQLCTSAAQNQQVSRLTAYIVTRMSLVSAYPFGQLHVLQMLF
jgi:hypothetical protein